MDDLVLFAQYDDDFVNRTRVIFERLRKHNITINPEKCVLGASSITYTGHILDAEGIFFSRDKLTDVVNFRKPVTQKELKSFLGMVTYFHI